MDKYLILSIAFQLVSLPWLVVPVNTSKIVEGYNITIKEAPYQVWLGLLVINEIEFGGGFLCSGTVVSQRLVLFPAVCFHHTQFASEELVYTQYVVVAGGAAWNVIDEHVRQYNIKKLIKHPDYEPDAVPTSIHDIALAFLAAFIPWDAPRVKAIQLAERGPTMGQICLTSGWGVTEVAEMEYPSNLNQAEVTVVDHVCYDNSTEIKITFILTDPDKTHVGDMGAPLICSNQLSGILNTGIWCGPPYGGLGLYTNISYYRDWILSVNATFENSDSSAFDIRRSINLRDSCFVVLYIFLLWAWLFK